MQSTSKKKKKNSPRAFKQQLFLDICMLIVVHDSKWTNNKKMNLT